ncbi:MAG: alpha-galactosidase, partial [Bacteroidales bacterium]|nr:alpha-galactosidase [Bacteroidales bacterium]
TFAQGVVPPFSFTLDGKSSDTFIKSWSYSQKKMTAKEPNSTAWQFNYTDRKTGLKVTVDAVAFADYKSAEWTLRFTAGGVRTGRISNVRSADFEVKEKSESGYTLRRNQGSGGSVEDFRIINTPLKEGEQVKVAPAEGRSSSITSLPFFNIIGSDGGAFFSVGWSGTWNATFEALPKQSGFSVKSGLEFADFYLEKGESVRASLVNVLFWDGKDDIAAHNLLRKFFLAHHSHRIDGKVWAPLLGGLDWGDPEPCNEYTCLTEDLAKGLIRRYAQLNIVPDVIWLDAGWYEGPDGATFDGNYSWYEGVGNWVVDRERFPSGFQNISALAHAMGCDFMVWFESERVRRNSLIWNAHPEWILTTGESDWNGLLNLGIPEACDFLTKLIGDVMESEGIDHYRQDFNIGADIYWAVNDTEGRRGITEMKYVEGIYRFWDGLMARFPNMRIDNCAGGGRRIDLETISRAVPLWRTDYSYGTPLGYQCHTYGISLFVPQNGTGIYNADFYRSRSGYTSASVLNFQMLTRTNETAYDFQRVYNEYRSIQGYFLKDYYPLSGFDDICGEKGWIAYQFHDAESKSGIVMAFRRRESKNGSYSVNLREISPLGEYEVTNCNTGEVRNIYGGDLMNAFVINLDGPEQGVLFKYRKL